MKNTIFGATTATPVPLGNSNLSGVASAISKTVNDKDKTLTVNDVSPLTHKCSLKLTSDTYEEVIGGSNNIFDFKNNGDMKMARKYGGGSSPIDATCTVNDNGTVTINGFVSIDMRPVLSITISGFETGKEYTFSIRDKDGNLLNLFVEPMLNGVVPDGMIEGLDGRKFTFTAEDKYPTYKCFVDLTDNEDGNSYDNVTFYPQLEYGSVATTWSEYGGNQTEIKPYIEDFSTVKVEVNGKIYIPKADGTVENIESVFPSMEVTTDNDKVNITDFTYCVDTKKYIDSNSGGGSALGDIETALDSIIAIQESLIGGDA